MKKFLALLIISVLSGNMCVLANTENKNSNIPATTVQKAEEQDIILKNKMFSVVIPAAAKGSYVNKTKNDAIYVYHKESKKAGYGGFAFGIKAYEKPADHAEIPGGKKLGELTGKNGVLYDIVILRPTDVQFDYTKKSEAPESYMFLYKLGDTINIQGVNGSTYFKNQGMKGEKLYKEVLKKHITAIKEKWDSAKLEKENMSYMYNVINSSNKNALNKIGYIYSDVNGDGIDELLIGEIAEGALKGIVYDMYTMVDRKTKHVVSGGNRNRYFVCENGFISNEYSSGAKESGIRTYFLTENSTELFPQVSFKYDGYSNPKNPYFISYGNGEGKDDWENVTDKKFNERIKTFTRYKRFNFIPLSKIK